MDELAWLDATAQAALVRTGEVGPRELVDAAIARIERLNPHLNAVVHPLFERARSDAESAPDGPFRGVPLLLKDLMAEMEGTPFSEGTDLSGHHTSPADQLLTARFRQAGLVVCGKTNTPELGILPTTEPRRFGATHNPWDPTRTPGGSSGGSAAAVASGMVPVAHANDGGGSIRIPASCCGLVGLKPSRGRVSMAPQYGDAYSGLIAEHVVTRSVRDSAAILDVVAQPVPGEPYVAPPPTATFLQALERRPRLRVGLLTESPSGTTVDRHCVDAAEAAARLCESAGHTVVPTAFPVDGASMTAHFVNVWAAGNAWVLLGWEERIGRPARPEDVEPLTWALVELGRSIDSAHHLRSVQELQRVARHMAAAFDAYDVLLTPTLGELPPPLGSFDSPSDDPLAGLFRAASFIPFTPPFNISGQPAVSLPLHWTADGLPVGVQLAAPLGAEETLIGLAAELEEAQPWADRRPRVTVDTY